MEVTRGASLAGENYACEGKYIRITLGNFNYKEGGFKEDKQKDNLFYTGEIDSRFILHKGDILTPLTEQALGLLGSTIRIPEDNKYIQSQDVALLTCNEELLDKEFCYYLIPSKMVRQQLSAAAQQTSIRHTSPDKIKACKVYIPELAEQKKIAKLLHSIEDKINLNRQINRNLEALAKQIYDYWFVQFDFPDEKGRPYKSSGGKMVYNEMLKREIPDGWSIDTIGNLLGKNKSTPRLATEEYNKYGLYPIIDQSCENYIAGFTDRQEAVLNNYPVVVFGDHSCSVKYVNFAFCRGADGTQILYSEDERASAEYLYFAVKGVRISQGYARHFSFLKSSPIILPKIEVAKAYHKHTSILFTMIKENRLQVFELQKQLDVMLPLLMNGQANSDLSVD